MCPTDHDNLFFDDETFSRSRRYFWAIDCLSEFDVSISDNINQWNQYKAARLQHLLDQRVLSELDMQQFKHAERYLHMLQSQLEYLRRKLAATKALRDAVGASYNSIELLKFKAH